MSNSNEQVRLTADDAIICKMACSDLGYYKDRYIHHFIKRKAKRTPLINRGYYSRVVCIDTLVKRFIQQYEGKCQVISLGGGYDTLFFRLHDEGLQPQLFIDFDLMETCIVKSSIIRHFEELSSVVFGDSSFDREEKSASIYTDHYILEAMDLCDLEGIRSFFAKKLADPTLPTLLLAECVFIYISPESLNPSLQYLQSVFPNSGIVVYEQVYPNDPFGAMMISNLHDRGCDLLSISSYPDIESQKERYLGLGYTKAFCATMKTMYEHFIEAKEIQRISRIELFDEFEEWNLIQSHYCIVVSGQGSLSDWFSDWVCMCN